MPARSTQVAERSLAAVLRSDDAATFTAALSYSGVAGGYVTPLAAWIVAHGGSRCADAVPESWPVEYATTAHPTLLWTHRAILGAEYHYNAPYSTYLYGETALAYIAASTGRDEYGAYAFTPLALSQSARVEHNRIVECRRYEFAMRSLGHAALVYYALTDRPDLFGGNGGRVNNDTLHAIDTGEVPTALRPDVEDTTFADAENAANAVWWLYAHRILTHTIGESFATLTETPPNIASTVAALIAARTAYAATSSLSSYGRAAPHSCLLCGSPIHHDNHIVVYTDADPRTDRTERTVYMCSSCAPALPTCANGNTGCATRYLILGDADSIGVPTATLPDRVGSTVYLCPTCDEDMNTGEIGFQCHRCDGSFVGDPSTPCDEDGDDIDSNSYCRRCADEVVNESIGPRPRVHCYTSDDYPPSMMTADETRAYSAHRRPPVYFGVELEMEYGSHKTAIQRVLAETPLKDRFMLKSDGSLTNGVELVTSPITFDRFAEDSLAWITLLDDLRAAGARSYNTTTCGMHVHMTRTALSGLQMYRIMELVYGTAKLFRFISQRSTYNYCTFSDVEDNPRMLKVKTFQATNDRVQAQLSKRGRNWSERSRVMIGTNRHSAINIPEDLPTMEFRFFRGTLAHASFFKNLECVDALLAFTSTRALTDLTDTMFTDFVHTHRARYTMLSAFLSRPTALAAWKFDPKRHAPDNRIIRVPAVTADTFTASRS